MSENIVCKTAVVANITEPKFPSELSYTTQIPVGIILYEMKKGLNKRFFQKKTWETLDFFVGIWYN